jgi:hypothetical protein
MRLSGFTLENACSAKISLFLDTAVICPARQTRPDFSVRVGRPCKP